MANQRFQLGLMSGLVIAVVGLAWNYGRDKVDHSSQTNPVEEALAGAIAEAKSAGSQEVAASAPGVAAVSGKALGNTAGAADNPEDSARASAEALRLDSRTRETVLACVREAKPFQAFRSAQDFSSLDELMRGAENTSGTAARREVQVRNLHVKTPSGETLRLHFAPGDFADGGRKGESPRLRMKLFGVDRENLPVPKELPKELKDLGSDQAIARFKAQGEVVFDEVSYSLSLGENVSASVTERGGRIERLETFLGKGALACDAQDGKMLCHCL